VLEISNLEISNTDLQIYFYAWAKQDALKERLANDAREIVIKR
jgi:hypothetical protein